MTQKASRRLAYFLMFGLVCNLVYFLIPVPTAVIRGIIIIGCLLAIFANLKYRLTAFDKACLIFAALNLIYYCFGILHHNFDLFNVTSTTTIFVAFPAFSCLARRGAINQRFILVAAVTLCIACVYYYMYKQAQLFQRRNLEEDAHATINASVVFLMLIPMVFLLRNKLISFGIFCVCIFFIISSVKRGNIVAAVIPTILYIRLLLIKNKSSAWKLLTYIALIIFAGIWVADLVTTNEFFQQRYESTLEGDSSHRDVIYRIMWDLWYTDSSDLQKFFGFGYEGTRLYGSDGRYAHNDWLEILVDFGMLGILAYLAVFVTFYKMLSQTKGIEGRSVMLSILAIWLVKTCVSMGFTDEKIALLAISYGTVVAWYIPRFSKSIIR